MKKIFIYIVIALAGFNLIAQDITFTASAPGVVAVGEQFRLSFSVNKNADKITPPDLRNFYILMGPSTSFNQSTQIINGKMTRTVSYTYTYVLQATKEGKFQIDPATVTIKNKTYQSNSLEIEVVIGETPAASGGEGSQTESNAIASPEDDLFLRLHVNKSTVYRGEHIVAIIKIYSRVNLSGLENATFPSFNGFLREDIETPALRSLERENVNGVIYGTGVLQRIVLFPQVTGELVIDPMELECLVQQRVQQTNRGFFDSFLDSYQNIKQTIESPPVTITVKNLPEGAPDSFKGSVGQISMDATIDNYQVKENEAMNLRVKFSGNGNVKLTGTPEINFPPDFDVYDPKVSTNLNNSTAGTSGSKTFEILAIPRHAGNYRVPPIEFAYFDPSKEEYKVLRSDEFNLVVTKDADSENGALISGFTREDLRFIGSDIRFIKNRKIKLHPRDRTFFGSIPFYLIYLISIIAFGLLIIFRRNHIKRNADLNLVKNRKANKVAKKRLKLANSYLQGGMNNEFYDELLKAFWGYLSDKLGIPVSELSKENARKELENYQIETIVVDELFEIIDRCEYARFAPSEELSDTVYTYEKASRVISLVEQKLR